MCLLTCSSLPDMSVSKLLFASIGTFTCNPFCHSCAVEVPLRYCFQRLCCVTNRCDRPASWASCQKDLVMPLLVLMYRGVWCSCKIRPTCRLLKDCQGLCSRKIRLCAPMSCTCLQSLLCYEIPFLISMHFASGLMIPSNLRICHDLCCP